MRINPFVYGALVLVVFVGAIWAFQSAGIWSISGKVDTEGQAIEPSAADVNTIKGWMTFEQVADAFSIPVEEIYNQFGVPLDTPPSTPIKDMESETFDPTLLREWLAARQTP